MLLCHGGLIQSGAINPNQHVASYWSAAAHDYQHGGLNNDFLIKTMHPLAALYNDQSPLENHHVSAASMLFGVPEYAYLPVRDGPQGKSCGCICCALLRLVSGCESCMHAACCVL